MERKMPSLKGIMMLILFLGLMQGGLWWFFFGSGSYGYSVPHLYTQDGKTYSSDEEGKIMPIAQNHPIAKPGGPPIDAAAPKKTVTATFGMG